MKQRKKLLGILFVIVVVLLGLAGYLYYNSAKIVSNTITPEENTTEATSKIDSQATTEQRKKLPNDYVWDTKRLGEPPQIVYDFAENQERFDYIVEKVDSIISEDDGFSTGIENNKIYYDSGYNNLQEITTDNFKKNITFLFKNTKFYEFTKDRSGYWIMHYNQEENSDRFIFIMANIPGMTDEQAYEEGYYRVVGDWFFGTIWKI